MAVVQLGELAAAAPEGLSRLPRADVLVVLPAVVRVPPVQDPGVGPVTGRIMRTTGHTFTL
jgi:hypothetical protein